MVRIAVTGGIASGKSAVGLLMARRGVAVCEADELAHALMARGAPVHGAIVDAFGPGILAPDGGIDRQALGRRVFADERERLRLNAIVHPEVIRRWESWLREREGDAKAAAVIVPLLYEIGGEAGWDAVVCVLASEAVQVARLGGRGLQEPDARRRIAAQLSPALKAERADYVIVNDGTLESLKEQTMRALRSILEK